MRGTLIRFRTDARGVSSAGDAGYHDHTASCHVGDHHALAVAGGIRGEPDAALAAKLTAEAAVLIAAEQSSAAAGVKAARSELIEQLARRSIDGNATLAVAVNTADGVDVAWTGNCRVYVLRGGDVERVTVDHTHGAERQAIGLAVDAYDEYFDLLTSSVATVDGPVGQILLTGPIDRLLLCTAGVGRVLTEVQLHMFLLRRQRPAAVLEELATTITRLGPVGSATAVLAEPVWATP